MTLGLRVHNPFAKNRPDRHPRPEGREWQPERLRENPLFSAHRLDALDEV